MSTRTSQQLTNTIHINVESYLIVLSRIKKLLTQIPFRTIKQRMAQILPLYHLTTIIYSSKMEKNTAQKKLTK